MCPVRPGRRSGFTLVELMIVVAIIAVIASIAVPNMASARLAANEAAACATLRTIATAQAQLQASGRVDVDGDGVGEFGMFRELSGRAGVRVDRAGTPGGVVAAPAPLSGRFAQLNADGECVKSGFHFKVFVPGHNGLGASEIDMTAVEFAGLPAIETDLAETMWSAYAWPAQGPFSGRYTFFVSERGDLTKSERDPTLRSGPNGIEVTEAGFALIQGTGPRESMLGPVAIGQTGRDGVLWIRVN